MTRLLVVAGVSMTVAMMKKILSTTVDNEKNEQKVFAKMLLIKCPVVIEVPHNSNKANDLRKEK